MELKQGETEIKVTLIFVQILSMAYPKKPHKVSFDNCGGTLHYDRVNIRGLKHLKENCTLQKHSKSRKQE